MKQLKPIVFSFFIILSSCVKHHVDDGTAAISVTIEPMGTGSVTGEGDYLSGDSVMLTAIPSYHQVFAGWNEDGILIGTQNPYVFIAGPDRQLVAMFEDYRQRLYGNYSGTRNDYSWNMSMPIAYDTTYAYSFAVNAHPSLDSIRVDNRTFPFDTTYEFYAMPYPGQITSLEFVNDSCKLYLRSGGLGGFSSTTINAVKN